VDVAGPISSDSEGVMDGGYVFVGFPRTFGSMGTGWVRLSSLHHEHGYLINDTTATGVDGALSILQAVAQTADQVLDDAPSGAGRAPPGTAAAAAATRVRLDPPDACRRRHLRAAQQRLTVPHRTGVVSRFAFAHTGEDFGSYRYTLSPLGVLLHPYASPARLARLRPPVPRPPTPRPRLEAPPRLVGRLAGYDRLATESLVAPPTDEVWPGPATARTTGRRPAVLSRLIRGSAAPRAAVRQLE
jgi:hypothetical protein